MSLATKLTNSPIEAEYRQRTPTSAKLYAEEAKVVPAGVTHDSRYLTPHPPFVARASGPRKWDVDGNEYVDYYGGHGALLLGHAHPAMVEAVEKQIRLGTHYGASHELELRWAQLVNRLIPCAERVRFTASGTEASHLALRMARAFTGKPKIIRFLGHFHGWHDQVAPYATSHFDGATPVGILPALAEQMIALDHGDVDNVVRTIESRDDVAAVIFEASGASWGTVPFPPGFQARMREVTKKKGVVLIFDEVITGFRWSKGGVQRAIGVTPDMCILAKIIAGGLPGGAVAGRADILDQLDPAAMKKANREKIGHQGTYNANPLCAAAGVATLSIIEKEPVCETAAATGKQIRDGMRQILIEEHIPWGVYGESSGFIIFTNPQGLKIDPASFDPLKLGFKGLKAVRDPGIANKMRIAMLANGVDIMGAPGGVVSATHGPAEVAITLEAFRKAVRALKAEGDVRG
jgi:glutamate-1-semialdehyde 2,1-aminomutase